MFKKLPLGALPRPFGAGMSTISVSYLFPNFFSSVYPVGARGHPTKKGREDGERAQEDCKGDPFGIS